MKLSDANVFIGLFLTIILTGGIMGVGHLSTRDPSYVRALGHQDEGGQDVFDHLGLSANAYVVYDISNQKIISEKNSTLQLPLASITKIMTALLAREIAPREKAITVNPDQVNDAKSQGLKKGEKWSLSAISSYFLVNSSNGAAASVAESFDKEDFVRLMNGEARNLRLEQTFFLNPTGLDESAIISGAYSSAADVARLLSYVITKYPKMLEVTRFGEIDIASFDQSHFARNTNPIVKSIPNVLASKTGLTDLAHGNLALAFEVAPLHKIAIIVLGSTEKARFSDSISLYKATLESYLHEHN